MFCACNISREQILLDQFSAQVKEAKTITATILVKDDSGMEVSSGSVVIDFQSKQRTVTLKTPNIDFTADGNPWKIENSTSDYPTDSVTFDWNVKDFQEINYDEQSNSCNGVIDGDMVNKLGLADVISSTQDAVNVKLLVTGGDDDNVTVNSVELSYSSSTNNTVIITLTTSVK